MAGVRCVQKGVMAMEVGRQVNQWQADRLEVRKKGRLVKRGKKH